MGAHTAILFKGAAAKTSKVKQLVYTSGCTARKENAIHPMIKGHLAGEECIEKVLNKKFTLWGNDPKILFPI